MDPIAPTARAGLLPEDRAVLFIGLLQPPLHTPLPDSVLTLM